MKVILRSFIFLFILTVLTGCGLLFGIDKNEVENSDGVQSESSVEDNEDESAESGADIVLDDEEDKGDEVTTELSKEEAHDIVYDHYLIRHKEMRNMVDVFKEKENGQDIYNPDSALHQQFKESIKELFYPMVAQEKLDEMVDLYAEIYTCSCDAYSVITPNLVNVKFELLSQNEEEFEVSFVELGDKLYPESGQYKVRFIKEQETWKNESLKYIPYEGQAYGLTPEDLENSQINYSTYDIEPLEFVEYRTVEGVEVIVMKNDYGEFSYGVDSGKLYFH